VTGYPATTLVFCAVCVFLIYGAVAYKPAISAAAIGVMLLGLPIYWLTNQRGKGPSVAVRLQGRSGVRGLKGHGEWTAMAVRATPVYDNDHGFDDSSVEPSTRSKQDAACD
jgi:hypothetical protein